RMDRLQTAPLPIAGGDQFEILESSDGEKLIQVAPDGPVCDDCLRELFDPADRRYHYPFITCTNCGPRYSLITGIPYDRSRTTMAIFPLCKPCRTEYDDPTDRRFHAQPIACPHCGPHLSLITSQGKGVDGDPLLTSAKLLASGAIIAIKGIGGFHLAVDATNDEAVHLLRQRKRRDEKPLAVMVVDLPMAEQLAHLSPLESRFLATPERPILLLRRRESTPLSPSIAPGNGNVGIMLPSAPLQHLLLAKLNRPLVMTSANLSDEPTAFDDQDALQRLATVADYFLTHNRPIQTRVDDSVIRLFGDAPLFLRRSRGYTPRAIGLPAEQPSVLALGGELKNCACLTRGPLAFMTQHIGDLKEPATLDSLRQSAVHLQHLLRIEPVLVAHDLHPDYLSTQLASQWQGLPSVAVQHHHAHFASCLAEHQQEGPAIGVVFDGTGYGLDGTIWGGEFLVGDCTSFRRLGHFLPLPLPGGDAAVREPWRVAMVIAERLLGSSVVDSPLPAFAGIDAVDRQLVLQMAAQGINSPQTSSCGRLFDAAAALLGIRQRVSYEGQAPLELESMAEAGITLPVTEGNIDSTQLIADPLPLFQALLDGMDQGVQVSHLARTFHLSLATLTAQMCECARQQTSLSLVALSGGVFQNRLFTEDLCRLLKERGFTVLTHRLVPPNDGGLALGQAVIAARSGLCA
ncbi:MAG TPA: carbamoyltransferase HypF, partial [Geobacterales bacterium]|nr:carbamoyltransferase HypF [Geobacterales bacterium]